MRIRRFASYAYNYWDKYISRFEKNIRENRYIWGEMITNIKWQIGNGYKYSNMTEEQYTELIKRVLMYERVRKYRREGVYDFAEMRESFEDKELFDKHYYVEEKPVEEPKPVIYANGKEIIP